MAIAPPWMAVGGTLRIETPEFVRNPAAKIALKLSLSSLARKLAGPVQPRLIMMALQRSISISRSVGCVAGLTPFAERIVSFPELSLRLRIRVRLRASFQLVENCSVASPTI